MFHGFHSTTFFFYLKVLRLLSHLQNTRFIGHNLANDTIISDLWTIQRTTNSLLHWYSLCVCGCLKALLKIIKTLTADISGNAFSKNDGYEHCINDTGKKIYIFFSCVKNFIDFLLKYMVKCKHHITNLLSFFL